MQTISRNLHSSGPQPPLHLCVPTGHHPEYDLPLLARVLDIRGAELEQSSVCIPLLLHDRLDPATGSDCLRE